MISAWIVYLLVLGLLILVIAASRSAYRGGVWDGAFNQFLPHVQKEMVWYDEHRSRGILGDAVVDDVLRSAKKR